MRIMKQEATGGPEVLAVQEAEKPQPKNGEVLIKVHAAGVNPVDRYVRAGWYPLIGKPPFTVGWDASGEVTGVGAGVTEFKTGDHVFGLLRFPKEAAAYADYVAAPANEITLKPDQITDVEAAALPLSGLTAWQGLVHNAKLKAGEKLLVQGAAGGVGHLAVQIGKALGAKVTATASSGKLDYLRSIGADVALNSADWSKAAGTDFDVVFDPISGDNAVKSLEALKKGGRLVVLLEPSAEAKALAEAEGKTLYHIGVHASGDDMKALADLVRQGKLKPHVAKTFPLEDAGNAQEFLETKPVGKIVLTV